jgi:hypothetical protein
MLYLRKDLQNVLCLIEVSLSVMIENEYLITDGNAASHDTNFYNSVSYLKHLPWNVLDADYWYDHFDGKRKRCAEILIYPRILPKFITNIYCYSNNVLDVLSGSNKNVCLKKSLFFKD